MPPAHTCAGALALSVAELLAAGGRQPATISYLARAAAERAIPQRAHVA